MREAWFIAGCAAAWLALAGCSPSNDAKKNEAAAPAAKKEQAPDVFKVLMDTSKGPVVIEVHRDWAPIGADHFYTLVKLGYYDGNRFFRIVRDFVVQFGINGNPEQNRLWANANLLDDPVKESNVRGTITYATSGPNTRSTQLFINLADNKRLDAQGFAPFGKVISGMEAVDSFYKFYGEMAPRGQGPDPSMIEAQGNDYLTAKFPRLDFIKTARVQ